AGRALTAGRTLAAGRGTVGTTGRSSSAPTGTESAVGDDDGAGDGAGADRAGIGAIKRRSRLRAEPDGASHSSPSCATTAGPPRRRGHHGRVLAHAVDSANAAAIGSAKAVATRRRVFRCNALARTRARRAPADAAAPPRAP